MYSRALQCAIAVPALTQGALVPTHRAPSQRFDVFEFCSSRSGEARPGRCNARTIRHRSARAFPGNANLPIGVRSIIAIQSRLALRATRGGVEGRRNTPRQQARPIGTSSSSSRFAPDGHFGLTSWATARRVCFCLHSLRVRIFWHPSIMCHAAEHSYPACRPRGYSLPACVD